jgi:serine phosphatase RsbU (regulator of sigma subunit)
MQENENKSHLSAWDEEVRRLMVASSAASWPLTSFCSAFFIFVEIYHRKEPGYITPFYFIFFGGAILVLVAHLLRKKINYPFFISAYGTSVVVPLIATSAAIFTVPENVFTYFLITSLVIVVRGLLYCQEVKTLATIAVFSHSLILITTLLVRKEPYFSLPNILSTNIIQLFMIMFSLSGTSKRYALTKANFLNTLRIQNAARTIEEKNKDITDSINYARRIQSTLLPKENFLRDNLREHCVFFRPKDIVSGDFYWASRMPNGEFTVVVADSTGHGVPGAIMSMLNIASLNEVLAPGGVVSPSRILDHARKRIIDHLNNQEYDEGAKDGMDAVVISIDKNFSTLSFAGANNSLWMVRNGQVTQVKGDKMSVGKDGATGRLFTETTIALQEDDLLFMVTDGYTDQFGGHKGKKFMISRFRELMEECASLPMHIIQHKLSTAFDTWKGEHEQTDDVLVFAIRVAKA